MVSQRLTRFRDNTLPDLKRLADVDPELLASIATALIDVTPCLTAKSLATLVSDSIERDEEEVGPVILILWRLALMERSLEENANSFISELTACLDVLADSIWPPEYRRKWNQIVSELVRGISQGSAVYLSAKAQNLLSEQSLLLCAARIITDMRPIFNDDADVLEGMLPFHTLVLKCHQNDSEEHTNIHVAIDRLDLLDLRDQIERAERKEQLMRETLSGAGYTIIGFEGVEGQMEIKP